LDLARAIVRSQYRFDPPLARCTICGSLGPAAALAVGASRNAGIITASAPMLASFCFVLVTCCSLTCDSCEHVEDCHPSRCAWGAPLNTGDVIASAYSRIEYGSSVHHLQHKGTVRCMRPDAGINYRSARTNPRQYWPVDFYESFIRHSPCSANSGPQNLKKNAGSLLLKLKLS